MGFNLIYRYLSTGILNTVLGYLLFLLFYTFDVNVYNSNLLSYAIMIFVSFTLYSKLVFSYKIKSTNNLLLYFFTILISYAANLIILYFSLAWIDAYYAHFSAMLAYSLTFFIVTLILKTKYEN